MIALALALGLRLLKGAFVQVRQFTATDWLLFAQFIGVPLVASLLVAVSRKQEHNATVLRYQQVAATLMGEAVAAGHVGVMSEQTEAAVVVQADNESAREPDSSTPNGQGDEGGAVADLTNEHLTRLYKTTAGLGSVKRRKGEEWPNNIVSLLANPPRRFTGEDYFDWRSPMIALSANVLTILVLTDLRTLDRTYFWQGLGIFVVLPPFLLTVITNRLGDLHFANRARELIVSVALFLAATLFCVGGFIWASEPPEQVELPKSIIDVDDGTEEPPLE